MSRTAFTTPSAAITLFTKTENGIKKVLCMRRSNTGFADGLLDFCSGKVESGETIAEAAVREAKEELGIKVDKSQLKFLCLVHKRDGDVIFYNAYFECERFIGEPKICEPEKCSHIEWVPLDDCPPDLIDDRGRVIEAVRSGVGYLEYGWKS